MEGMRYTVVLRPDPETPGVWLAEVPALPWCATFGHSPEEALENAKDALEAALEALEALGEAPPPDVTVAQISLDAA